VAEFIKHNECPNRLTNPYVCRELFKLLPKSDPFEDPIFRTSKESASMDYQSKYTAWEQWVTNAIQSLTKMHTDSRAGAVTPLSAPPSVHPVLVATSQSTQPREVAEVAAMVGRVEKMEANRPLIGGLQHQDKPLSDGFTVELPTTCRFCTFLSKSSITDTTTYNNIKALSFNTKHKP
jgi:hypothetical protein